MAAPIEAHAYSTICRYILQAGMCFVGLSGIAAFWFGIHVERKESR